MRLVNTSTLAVQLFDDHDVPAYCTASLVSRIPSLYHTDPNVPSNAVATRGCASTTLIGLCNVAKAHQFDWLWLGSYCIDWSSKAERDQAYNLFARWMSRAKACIAYLHDVTMVGPVDRDHPFTHSEYVQSQWFRSGWTLQPLVTAKEVVFVDTNFIFLGTRSRMKRDISDATGINVCFLDGTAHFSEASIAERMSWASRRTFAVPEDEAYCLIGLMEVKMSSDYGEGRTFAFYRLQRKILANSSDQSIFAWISPNFPEREPVGLLASSVRDFFDSHNVINTPSRSPTMLSHRYTQDHGVEISRCIGNRKSYKYGPEEALLTLRCNLSGHQERRDSKTIAVAVRRIGSHWYRVSCGDWLFSREPEYDEGLVETFYIAQPGLSVNFQDVDDDIDMQSDYEHEQLQRARKKAAQKYDRQKVIKTAVAIAVPMLGALVLRRRM